MPNPKGVLTRALPDWSIYNLAVVNGYLEVVQPPGAYFELYNDSTIGEYFYIYAFFGFDADGDVDPIYVYQGHYLSTVLKTARPVKADGPQPPGTLYGEKFTNPFSINDAWMLLDNEFGAAGLPTSFPLLIIPPGYSLAFTTASGFGGGNILEFTAFYVVTTSTRPYSVPFSISQ